MAWEAFLFLPSFLSFSRKFLLFRYLRDNDLTGTIPTQLHISGLNLLELAGSNNFCPIANYSVWAASNDFSSQPTVCHACATSFPTCQNGGTCLGGANTAFTCSCAAGYGGANCQGELPRVVLNSALSHFLLHLKLCTAQQGAMHPPRGHKLSWGLLVFSYATRVIMPQTLWFFAA